MCARWSLLFVDYFIDKLLSLLTADNAALENADVPQ